MKRLLSTFLLGFWGSLQSQFLATKAAFPEVNVRSIDGNMENPLGGAGAFQLRLARHACFPGNGTGDEMDKTPNARKVSNALAAQDSDLPNSKNFSDMLWAWGQFLDHDITLTDSSTHEADKTTINYANDPDNVDIIPFKRSAYTKSNDTHTREQMNGITSFIDASNVYGSDNDRAVALRKNESGKLLTSADGRLLPLNFLNLKNAGEGPHMNKSEFFIAGDIRANEQLGLTALHTLFVREHNRLAEKLAEKFNETDEKLYQMARKLVGAEMQIITYKEFLPALLGSNYTPKLCEYDGYNSSVNPAIATEFSTVAFRVGHTMLSSNLKLYPHGESVSLVDAFFNTTRIRTDPTGKYVDKLLLGFRHQKAQEVDNKVIDEVRNFLFGPPNSTNMGHDLAALNIQRGRDHGILKYNALRVAMNLPPKTSIDDITEDTNLTAALKEVYGPNCTSPNCTNHSSMLNDTDGLACVDAWVGGLAEPHVEGGMVGELFAEIIGDQFRRLMEGDKFFYLNDEDLYTKQQGGGRQLKPEIKEILDLDTLTLYQVIQNNINETLKDDTYEEKSMFIVEGAPNNVIADPCLDSRSGIKTPYSPPDVQPQGCLQDKWNDTGNEGELICATKSVFLESVEARTPLSCIAGKTVTVSIDASIRMTCSKIDLGWYVATDGGDAQNGTCIVNGLQEPYNYSVVDPDGHNVGEVTWADGDNDECGDINIYNANATINSIPLVIETEMKCADESHDGKLDFAICFTWRTEINNGDCTIDTNTPGNLTGSCYCTRYDVPNVEVKHPIGEPMAQC